MLFLHTAHATPLWLCSVFWLRKISDFLFPFPLCCCVPPPPVAVFSAADLRVPRRQQHCAVGRVWRAVARDPLPEKLGAVSDKARLFSCVALFSRLPSVAPRRHGAPRESEKPRHFSVLRTQHRSACRGKQQEARARTVSLAAPGVFARPFHHPAFQPAAGLPPPEDPKKKRQKNRRPHRKRSEFIGDRPSAEMWAGAQDRAFRSCRTSKFFPLKRNKTCNSFCTVVRRSVNLKVVITPEPNQTRQPSPMRRTNADAAADREREWLNEAQSTQARLKKQAKLIEKMQLQAGALLFDEAGAGGGG